MSQPYPFFSFVIPAHNEEKYISNTLKKLTELEYPKNRYEVIVVENGSRDATAKVVQEYCSANERMYFLTSNPGVSNARNKGAGAIDISSDWVVFLDADTLVEAQFLTELAEFLEIRKDKNVSIGTTEIVPYLDTSFRARAWFKLYDFGHKYTQTSYSIQICKSSVVRQIRYDENLRLAEDLQYILDAKKFGTFFFFPTKTVSTSTRRFIETGYWRLFFFWIFFGVMPHSIRKHIDYKVVR